MICLLPLGACLGSNPVRPTIDPAPRPSSVDPLLPNYEPPSPAVRDAIRTARESMEEARRVLGGKERVCSEPQNVETGFRASTLLDDLIDQGRAEQGCSVIRVQRARGPEYDRIDQGYARLIGRTFAQDLCAAETGNLSSWQKLQRGARGSHPRDALSNFDALPVSSGAGSEEDVALANSYAVLYSLGRAESSGIANEGEDMKAARGRKPAAIEAGLFQVSYDVMGQSPVYQPLKDYYAEFRSKLQAAHASGGRLALAQACAIEDEERPQLRWHRKQLSSGSPSGELAGAFATGGVCAQTSLLPAECFQMMNRYCPPFTAHFNSAAIRINRGHWGPLNVRSIRPTCGGIFEKILGNREAVCKQLKMKPGDDPAMNDD